MIKGRQYVVVRTYAAQEMTASAPTIKKFEFHPTAMNPVEEPTRHIETLASPCNSMRDENQRAPFDVVQRVKLE